MNVSLYLAMNDDNGYSIGKVRQIEAYVNNEHAYTLEPTLGRDVCTCEIFTGSNQLHTGINIKALAKQMVIICVRSVSGKVNQNSEGVTL